MKFLFSSKGLIILLLAGGLTTAVNFASDLGVDTKPVEKVVKQAGFAADSDATTNDGSSSDQNLFDELKDKKLKLEDLESFTGKIKFFANKIKENILSLFDEYLDK